MWDETLTSNPLKDTVRHTSPALAAANGLHSRMRTWHAILRAGVILVAAACLGGPGITEPKLIGEGRRALFIGNSYLYVMDVPALVQALADSAGGDKIAVATVAGPDLALVDHWNEGTSRRTIAKGEWEWVVLQQGPSSVQVNRDTLRMVTKLFADEMAKVGARPALFSAWPAESRRVDFPRAIESYRLAAQDVDGIFLPIAGAWLEAWEREAQLQLYSDGLHPSSTGAYLAALVIYAKLLGKSPVGLPARVRTRDGLQIDLPAPVATLLQEAAEQVVGDR